MTAEERNAKLTNLAVTIGVILLCVLFWQRLQSLIRLVIMLGVLVFIHELGHFLAARWMKVRVQEFALGFGPKLTTWMRRGGTDFTIRAVPLGGFVNMPGMMPDEVDVEGGLAGKPPAARALVFAAGPAMNLLLALVILCLVGFVIGTPRGGKEVYVATVTHGMPAERMGVLVGDRILSVGGVAITSSEQLQRLVRNMPLVETEVVVDRKGRILRFHGAPEVRVNPKTRQPEEDPSTHKPLQLIGIMPVPSTGPRVPLGTSMRNGVRMFGHAFADLWDTVRKGQIAENVGGPVEMYRTTRTVSQLPVWLQVDLITQLSISLAVFNLLPIPVLDGGHLFLLAIEVVRRRRLTADAVRVAQVVGLAVIGVLFVLIMYKDLTRLLTGS